MKKMMSFLLIGILTTLTLSSQAQNRIGKIIGIINDENQKPIESATASLLKAKDSSLIKVSISDKTGKFEFNNIPDDKYFVSVTSVGHAKSYSQTFYISTANPSIELKSIILKTQSKELKEVAVVGTKPFIEQKADRVVVNVDAAVSNVGATALEVLEKSPGVTIDKDGNISLKGKQGVTVMMDGRPTYLSQTELSNYLKNLPASAIDQIEIMTNPSAKYDAAGNSGIINIKTKKNRQKGFNGNLNLTYGQGFYWKTNNSLNVNYRTGKVNLFANASYSKWNNFQKLEINRKFKDASTKEVTAIFDQVSNMHNSNDNYNLKIGTDYYVSKKTTVGFVATGSYTPETFSSKNTSHLQDKNGVTDSIVYAVSNNQNKWKNIGTNLNFRHQFDSAGKELTADLDYIRYKSTSGQGFVSTSYNPDWIKQYQQALRGDLPVAINIYSAKIDYAQTILKDVKFETGFKSSYVETNNDANYFNVAGDGSESPDYGKTNHFLYKENINAAYLNLNKQFKKFGVQAGLRYEQTNYRGKQFGNPDQASHPDSSFTKGYGSLFPTLFLSYSANKNNQFALSVGRRIDRPAYEDLNPFLFFLDQFTYQAGNTFLRPQFTNNVELSHTFKGTVTTTLNYSYTKDFMTETFEQAKSLYNDKEYATIVRQGNIGRRQNAGIAISAQIPVGKWWTAILYTNLNYNKFNGPLYGENIEVDAINVLFNLNNQFKFNKGWSAELSGFYRTKGVEGQILIQPLGQASAGVSKQILKGKGTLKLNVRDIFYTMTPNGSINFQNTEAKFRNTRDSRVANLSFVYRFGKPMKDQQPRRKTGGAADEQSRIKNGNNGN